MGIRFCMTWNFCEVGDSTSTWYYRNTFGSNEVSLLRVFERDKLLTLFGCRVWHSRGKVISRVSVLKSIFWQFPVFQLLAFFEECNGRTILCSGAAGWHLSWDFCSNKNIVASWLQSFIGSD